MKGRTRRWNDVHRNKPRRSLTKLRTSFIAFSIPSSIFAQKWCCTYNLHSCFKMSTAKSWMFNTTDRGSLFMLVRSQHGSCHVPPWSATTQQGPTLNKLHRMCYFSVESQLGSRLTYSFYNDTLWYELKEGRFLCEDEHGDDDDGWILFRFEISIKAKNSWMVSNVQTFLINYRHTGFSKARLLKIIWSPEQFRQHCWCLAL